MLHDCREAFAETLEALASERDDIVAVANDSIGSSKLGGFRGSFPDRLFNVGIAEQTLVGTGAGLANAGLVPFVSSASCFLTARALEQIKADVAYSNTNVKLIGMSSGMAYGALGPTHHSIEDFAWLRAIANLVVVAPADPEETRQAVRAAAEFHGPIFLRISRMGVPDVHGPDYRFQIGKASVLREGTDVTLIANGVMAHKALEAADRLAGRGLEARVLNMATVRPIDREAIVAAARETGRIVTAEEHTVFGGLGSAVAEVVVQEAPVPMRMVGVPGEFAPTGEPEFLFEHFGLTSDNIAEKAEELARIHA
jgi:transketolase